MKKFNFSFLSRIGNPDPALYDDPIFAKRITSYSGRYLELHKKYATGLYFNEHHPKLMTVYYEDLKDNLEQELTRVLEFLKKVIDFTPDDAEKRIKCSLQEIVDNFCAFTKNEKFFV